MEEGKVICKKNNIIYKIILLVFGLIIVALIVGTAVVMNNSSKGDSDQDHELPQSYEEILPEDQVREKVSDLLQSSDADYDKIYDYYDEVISKAQDDKDYFFAAKIIIQKILFIMTNEYDCEKAQNYLNSLDFSNFPKDLMPYLQSNIESSMWWCNHSEDDG